MAAARKPRIRLSRKQEAEQLRAPAWGKPPANKDEGVTRLVEMMFLGQYRRGDCKWLAPKWDMNVSLLRQWTSEALRRLKAAESDQEVLAHAEHELDRIIAEGDAKDRVAAIRARVEIRGLLVRQHTVRQLPSEEEVDAVLRRHGINPEPVEKVH